MLDKISKISFLIIFLVCFTLNGCRKTNVSDTRGVLLESDKLPYIENIDETVIDEPDDIEEDEYTYEAEAAVTKVTSVLAAKDTYTHSGCDPNNNKYKNYYVGGNSYEFELTLSKADTIVSIVNPSGHYEMTVDEAYSPTSVRCVLTGTPTPQYKARNVKWTVTWQSGKKSNFYTKMIPLFTANMYGDASYHVAYTLWVLNPAKYSVSSQMGTPTNITSNWTPSVCDIIHYGSNHYGVISNTPVQVNTRINGVLTQVWSFKIKERNAKCTFSATTKTVKWWSGQKIPSAGLGRDSAYQFFRSL